MIKIVSKQESFDKGICQNLQFASTLLKIVAHESRAKVLLADGIG